MQTKYPILLIHGVAIKDIKFFKAFGRIDRILKIQGYHVYKSKNDAFGTIENNAAQLKEQILGILETEKVEKVNIIAHSKGGLDAKYLVTDLGMEDKIASLTTLCTPHKGSPVADIVLKFPHPLLKFCAFWLNLWYRIFGDKHPDSFAVCEQLKLVEGVETETVDFSDKVYCQSFSCKIERNKNNFLTNIPKLFSHYYDSNPETDGLVPVDSTFFGEYKGCLEGSHRHSEIIDFMVREKKKDKIYAFYSTLCEDLVKMGF